MLKQESGTHSGIAYIGCAVCGHRAYLTDWEPPAGIEPGLRRFQCAHDHRTHRFFTEAQLKRLANGT
ncbi:hypothetical protein ES705_36268 [subsurface metagenome]